MRAMPDVMTEERCDGYIERGRIVEGEFILLLVRAIRLTDVVFILQRRIKTRALSDGPR